MTKQKNKISRSARKYIRLQKAQLRRNSNDSPAYNEAVTKLYKRFKRNDADSKDTKK